MQSLTPSGLSASLDETYLELFAPLKPTIRQRIKRGVRRFKKKLRKNVIEGVPRGIEKMRGVEWVTAPSVLGIGGGEEEGEGNSKHEGEEGEEGDEWKTAPTRAVSVFSIGELLAVESLS